MNRARQGLVSQACPSQNNVSGKRIRLWAGVLAFFFATVALSQAPITGKWQGTTRNGTLVALNLESANGVLTGTVTRSEQSSPITDGKVSGKTFAFKTILGDREEALTGEEDGGQLRIWLDRQGREGTVVFDRVKE